MTHCCSAVFHRLLSMVQSDFDPTAVGHALFILFTLRFILVDSRLDTLTFLLNLKQTNIHDGLFDSTHVLVE